VNDAVVFFDNPGMQLQKYVLLSLNIPNVPSTVMFYFGKRTWILDAHLLGAWSTFTTYRVYL